MNEASSVRVDRKSRRKAASYFSTDAPEALFVKAQRSATTTPEPTGTEGKLEDAPLEIAEQKIEEEDQDQTLNLEGMDIDKLAVDGALAVSAINDVLQRIGIDISANGESSKKKSKKQMSPIEIKSNVQTQIILQLGRRMEKMQQVIDELKTKLDTTISQKHRIKKDRDETRARLIQVTADLKEKNNLLEENGNTGRSSIFDERELIDLILKDLKKPEGIVEESSRAVLEDLSEFPNEPDLSSTKLIHEEKNETDQEPLEDLVAIHNDTKDQLRKVIALMQVRKKYGAPTKLGVGLKSLITDDDINSLNPFKGNIRTPYKLDALNYQPKEAKMLIRQARNQVQYLFVSMSTRHQQLLNAKDNEEYISILEDQSSQTMHSLSVCLDLLCEEQIYAWRWRSKCKQLGKQLENIRNLFSRVNVQASRIARKKQRMVGSVLYKEYIKSDSVKNTTESQPSTPDNITQVSTMPLLIKPNMRSSANRKPSIRPDQRPSSTKSNLSVVRTDGDRSSISSIVSFPELENNIFVMCLESLISHTTPQYSSVENHPCIQLFMESLVQECSPPSTSLTKLVTDLGRRMSKRSSPEELVAKHIIPVEAVSLNFSPSLVAQKHALEQEKIKNSLNRKLSIRSTKDDLKSRNIIKASLENVSTMSEERFESKQTTLKSILKKRPDRDQLKQMNILKGSDADLVQAEKHHISSTLEHFLEDRPNSMTLKNSKILFFSEDIEVVATYKKTEYNRKPDEDLTFKRLTPQLKSQIREELNHFKKTEMVVHSESTHNTCFH